MSIHVEAYTASGVVRGVVARSGHLRDVLEAGGDLPIERATWQAHGWPTPSPAGQVDVPIDDLLVAIGDDDPTIPVHAAWHRLRVDLPPYVLTGELATLPGYDPGRALARPSGMFVVLRDAELGTENAAPSRPIGHVVLVNRYAVERVSADLMLGFYFPGAALEDLDAAVSV
jgi:hypothetical protein